MRLNPLSKKARESRPAFDAVYAAVDARTVNAPKGLCESCGVRRFAEHHHTRKPRRAFHAPEWVLRVCRRCHEACDAPYAQGRRVITGSGDGHFASEVVYAPDKFALRKGTA